MQNNSVTLVGILLLFAVSLFVALPIEHPLGRNGCAETEFPKLSQLQSGFGGWQGLDNCIFK